MHGITVASTSTAVVEVTLEGEAAPLRPTMAHKLFSEDRQAWVASRKLKIGESLRTRNGPCKILSIQSLPGGHRVYNLGQ